MSRDLASGEARVTGDSSGLAIEVTGEAGYRCSVGPESTHVLRVLYTKPVITSQVISGASDLWRRGIEAAEAE